MIPAEFKGDAILRSPGLVDQIASGLKCSPAAIEAVIEIEAPKGAFDAHGRPTILFEPHIFYRELTLLGKSGKELKGQPKRDKAVSAGLARKTWSKTAYGSTSSQYAKLFRAMAIDETAALRSCSWGSPQIMGFNHSLAGYKTVQAMVEAFCESEDNQLRAMGMFIAKKGLGKFLSNEDWASFAAGYNGAGYKANKYDTRLAAAFKRHSKAPTVTIAKIADLSIATPKIGSPRYDTEDAILGVQEQLTKLGYSPGGHDGLMGPLTKSAIRDFRADNKLPDGDTIDSDMVAAMITAKPRVLSEARSEATPADVREKVPEARANFLTKITAGIAGFFSAAWGLIQGAFSSLGDAKQYLEPVQEFFASVPTVAWAGLIFAVAGAIYWTSNKAEKDSVKAFQEGKRL